jgi:hypothetical protein
VLFQKGYALLLPSVHMLLAQGALHWRYSWTHMIRVSDLWGLGLVTNMRDILALPSSGLLLRGSWKAAVLTTIPPTPQSLEILGHGGVSLLWDNPDSEIPLVESYSAHLGRPEALSLASVPCFIFSQVLARGTS